MTTLLNPSLEQLINEIHAINRAWKVAREFGDIASLVTSLAEIKNRLQVRLLRQYAPDRVYLALDPDAEREEPLYGLRLRESVAGHTDAAHLPVRVAEELFSPDYIENMKNL
ncbi:hypothetical protein [Phormidium sp. CCY1219]|uniref:hypothetical protein n=1 Tax=Phormidium sp. CCY1219 TaxID=2886104 RepID=UPI002D1F89B7|nr:hypothetical protein [Phormidium sp. CCY1219]MEB3828083.1 hypothetical protein [Phormidium sp. CCY1219]